MHDELESVIRDVRRRWRLKLALRGLTWVVAAAAITLFVASLGMERLGFTPQSIVIARVIAYVAILGAAAVFLLRPLVRRVPDPRVALYLEEHEPTLDAAVVSAVEQGDAAQRARAAVRGAGQGNGRVGRVTPSGGGPRAARRAARASSRLGHPRCARRRRRCSFSSPGRRSCVMARARCSRRGERLTRPCRTRCRSYRATRPSPAAAIWRYTRDSADSMPRR